MIGRACGTVTATRGGLVHVVVPGARVGDGLRIVASTGAVRARVVAVDGTHATAAPFGAVDGIAAGDRALADPSVLALPLGTALLGRAIDAAGDALDGGPRVRGRRVVCETPAPVPERRAPCAGVLWTGVRAIDGPLAIARGARAGIVGAPGAGKTTLLDAIVRHADADAVVLALIGERGREAQRRIAALDPRTAIVCATSDRAPAERVRAAEVAFAQAAALRRRGLDVLLVVDSLARVSTAARDVALAAGEPAGRGGYPPSALAILARLLEIAGPADGGTITLIASVLADGDGEDDPIVVAARAALDGHIVLSERLARAGRFPAIDLARSASRTLADAASPAHADAARVLRGAWAVLDESREARALGVAPRDAFAARAAAGEAAIDAFLLQGSEPSAPEATLAALLRLADTLT